MTDLSKLAASLTEAQTYEKPPHGWTCFHCGETFTTPGAARDHFGFDPSYDPACRIKLAAERGLVMALRKAEADLEEMRGLLHDESCEAYRLYASQTTRHNAQIMAAEEAGYERGLADGRAHHPSDDATVERAIKMCPEDACGAMCQRCGGRGWIVDVAAIAAMREDG